MVFLPHFLIEFGGFLSIDLLSSFPLQFLITGLGGFSPTTWSFEAHQLAYAARMFSFVSRFSSSVQLIEWGIFYRVSIQDSSSTDDYILNGVYIQEGRQLWCHGHKTYQSYNLNMWPFTWSTHMILTRDLRTLFWHQVIINSVIRVTIPISWLRPNFLHHHSARLQQA